MNLKKIREILEQGLFPDDVKERMILKVLSEDENLIPQLLQILEYERQRKKKLLTEINFQLSRAHVGLEVAKFDKKGLNGDRFMEKEITKFYIDNQEYIGHCMKNLDMLKAMPQPDPPKFPTFTSYED